MGWIFEERNQIKFVTLGNWLQSGVDMGFSTRWGGISQPGYASLNLGLHVNDDESSVLENRKRYLAAFGIDLDKVVCGQQVHGNQVRKVGRSHRSRGAFHLVDAIPDCDAMITNIPEVYLLSFYADCVPLFYYDPANRAIGTAHCGWKGTLGGIATQTLAAMQSEFGTSPDTVQIFIGPGIGPCCFEIKVDLASQVDENLADLHDIITPIEGDVYKWDLPDTNRQLLVKEGVNPAHITMCELCTSCRTDLFYSYRKENGETGRMGALIGLRF